MSVVSQTTTAAGDPVAVRHNWSRGEILAPFALPLPELLFRDAAVDRGHFDPAEDQVSTQRLRAIPGAEQAGNG